MGTRGTRDGFGRDGERREGREGVINSNGVVRGRTTTVSATLQWGQEGKIEGVQGREVSALAEQE